MKIFTPAIVLLVSALNVYAGTDETDDFFEEALKEYEEFKNDAIAEYEDFRNKALEEYREFVEKPWVKRKAKPKVPVPKEEPPVAPVIKEEDKKKDKSIKYDDILLPPEPEPQPDPVFPIQEIVKPHETYLNFTFFGTECKVRINESKKFRLRGYSETDVAQGISYLSDNDYNNLVVDCISIREDLQLCDWAYLQLLNVMSEKYCGVDTNEAALLMTFVAGQSGYKVRLARGGNRLYMLYATKNIVFMQTVFVIDGYNYYPFDCDSSSLYICNAYFPSEKSVSLDIYQQPLLSVKESNTRVLNSYQNPDLNLHVAVNENQVAFYDTYPRSQKGNDLMTQWAMYANTPIDRAVRNTLYPGLKAKIAGKSKLEAAELILNLIQTGFVYEYDNIVWGYDRPLFAEESLYYPYCDCEDRSILFSRLIRDLVGLDVVLIYYPGHLTTAVCFDEYVAGAYIEINNRKFMICDPTIIGCGAPVGVPMHDLNTVDASVILLEK